MITVESTPEGASHSGLLPYNAMHLAATVELTIDRRIDGTTTAALRIELPLTSRYLERISSAASTVGVIFVSLVVLLPPLIALAVGVHIPLVIFVGVWGAGDTAIDLNREMETLENMHQYEGFSSR